MTRKLSKKQLIAMRPCDLSDRLQLFGERNTLTVRQALKAGATTSDLLWVAGQLGLGEKCALFAQRCADRAQTDAATAYAAYRAAYRAAANAADAANAAAAYRAADAAAAANAAAANAAAAAAYRAAAYRAADAAYRAATAECEQQRKDFINIFG